MLRRLFLAIALAVPLIGSSSVSTAADDESAYRDLATGSDFRLRVAAALALGKSRSPHARGALEKALKDPHPAVRAAAAAALGALGDSAALPALGAALRSESNANAKAQIQATVQRLSKKPAKKPRFLVELGKLENASAVKNASIGEAFRDRTRAQIAQVPGVELLDEGADIGAEAKSRKLPGFKLDASLTHLTKSQSSEGVSYSARVELLIRQMPQQSLKGSMSGSAKALADASSIRGQRQLEQLQIDAIAGAVESALRGAEPALEAAAR